MNNAVFGKTMENVTTNKKRNKLVSIPNYHTMNYISKDLSIIEMKKKNKNKNE